MYSTIGLTPPVRVGVNGTERIRFFPLSPVDAAGQGHRGAARAPDRRARILRNYA